MQSSADRREGPSARHGVRTHFLTSTSSYVRVRTYDESGVRVRPTTRAVCACKRRDMHAVSGPSGRVRTTECASSARGTSGAHAAARRGGRSEGGWMDPSGASAARESETTASDARNDGRARAPLLADGHTDGRGATTRTSEHAHTQDPAIERQRRCHRELCHGKRARGRRCRAASKADPRE